MLFIFEVWHASPRASRSPSAVTLRAAFQAASLPQAGVGGWLGPARVTRRGGLTANSLDIFGDNPQNQVCAVAAYEVPDGTSERRSVAILSAVRDRLELALAGARGVEGRWSGVTVTRFSAINGPESWWRSGESARTRTEEQFPVLSTDPDENPRGPTGPDTHPTTPAETLEQMADRANRAAEAGSGLLWAGAAAGLVALVGYAAWRLSAAQKAWDDSLLARSDGQHGAA